MKAKSIALLAEYFTGTAVVDHSVALQLPDTPQHIGKKLRARQFFAARAALEIAGYATKEEAEQAIKNAASWQ